VTYQPRQLHPVALVCETCQRPWPLEAPSIRPLTSRELDALSAWWAMRSVKLAARLIGVKEQRAKNLLAAARARSGVHTNSELAGMYLGELRSKEDLITSHKVSGRETG
jgi:hypothetical protein